MNWLQRLIPPRLPDGLADLPLLTTEMLDGAAAPLAPVEMPSDELMEICRRAAFAEYRANAKPTWRTTALLTMAWARQQQAQSLKLPPPGADPVATDEDLLKVLDPIEWADDARRALYDRGRADERTAILRALGVEP